MATNSLKCTNNLTLFQASILHVDVKPVTKLKNTLYKYTPLLHSKKDKKNS